MPYQIPEKNLLTNELHLTGSTIDLLRYDENLFSNLTLPSGLDRDTVIDTIIEKHGMTALAHPSPDWMKHFIGVWSKRHLQSWQKLYDSTQLEYDPIENYDRKEDITESREISRESSGKMSGTTGETTHAESAASNETKRDVSAENASDYQADSRDTGNGTIKDTGQRDLNNESETSGNESSFDKFTHTNRTHGNIGVTTSQQMIQSERELVRYVIYEEIADDFRDAFCFDIY